MANFSFGHLDDRDYVSLLNSNIDWDAQLSAITLMLSRNKHAREDFTAHIKDEEEEIKKYCGAHHHHYIEQHYDLYHTAVYRDATESMAAIGMIAPLVESILSQSLAVLGEKYHITNQSPPEHKRWKRAENLAKQKDSAVNKLSDSETKDLWDIQKYYHKSQGVQTNILNGFPQLSEACGLKPYLPKQFENWFKAIFTYRNFMFHGGFEWAVGRRISFTNLIKDNGWDAYFDCSKSNDEPWIYYLTFGTIENMPAVVGEMLDGLGKFALNLPSELNRY